MRRKLLAMLMLMGISACASPQYNYRPEPVDVSFPPLNQVVSAGVGEEMLRQGKYVEQDSILLHQAVSVGLGAYSFSPGYYTKVGQDDSSEFYNPEPGGEGGHVTKGVLADPYEAMQVMLNEPMICGVSVLGGKACADGVNFSRIKRPSLQSAGFQQVLLYSGRIGNRVNIGYREFSNNRARPAFNNDVEYDLTESKTIGYKGAEIEIFEATNRYIRYKVLRNFNAAKH